MKFLKFVYCIVVLLVATDSAYANKWRRAKGNLYMTRYEDTAGNTLADLDSASRVIRIDVDLRRTSRVRGIKTKCKANRRLRQESCRSVYYYNIPGEGRCLYVLQTTMHNFTSTSRNIYAFLESIAQCPSGFAAYAAAEGEIRRS